MNSVERFLAAAHCQPVDATPVWYMRQAGRCLQQYRDLRETYDILTITRTPELCAKVTLMPVEEFGVDAAVMYADIMLPLFGMDVPFSIDPGLGPIIAAPLRTPSAIAALKIVDPRDATPDLFEAIRIVRKELEGKTALVGFAGAPFTLASYMIEGKPSREYAYTKQMMYAEPSLWKELMDTLEEVTVRYLLAQVEAGAQLLQLFDSWAGALTRDAFSTQVLPTLQAIVRRVKEKADVPMTYFATDSSHLYPLFRTLGVDVVSIDWRTPLDEAWTILGSDIAVQGNLDPAAVLAPFASVKAEAQRVLERANSRPGHIFNLGHGVLPMTDPSILRELSSFVHETTRREIPEGVSA